MKIECTLEEWRELVQGKSSFTLVLQNRVPRQRDGKPTRNIKKKPCGNRAHDIKYLKKRKKWLAEAIKKGL